MTIHKVSARDYACVNASGVVNYIVDYQVKIDQLLNDNNDKLRSCNKSQLNAIAAELETVQKRLNYILYGRY